MEVMFLQAHTNVQIVGVNIPTNLKSRFLHVQIMKKKHILKNAGKFFPERVMILKIRIQTNNHNKVLKRTA